MTDYAAFLDGKVTLHAGDCRAAVAKSKNNLQGAEGTPLFGGEAA